MVENQQIMSLQFNVENERANAILGYISREIVGRNRVIFIAAIYGISETINGIVC